MSHEVPEATPEAQQQPKDEQLIQMGYETNDGYGADYNTPEKLDRFMHILAGEKVGIGERDPMEFNKPTRQPVDAFYQQGVSCETAFGEFLRFLDDRGKIASVEGGEKVVRGDSIPGLTITVAKFSPEAPVKVTTVDGRIITIQRNQDARGDYLSVTSE